MPRRSPARLVAYKYRRSSWWPLCLLRMATSGVLQHLYSLGTSSHDLLRYLHCLIQSDDQEQYLTSLRGSELTRLVDFLDRVRLSPPVSFYLTDEILQALDVTPITDDVSRRCLHKLQAICGHHRILPHSYNVYGDLTTVNSYPVAHGGFSDVWEGTNDGKRVCIKLLKLTQQTCQVVEKVCMCYR